MNRWILTGLAAGTVYWGAAAALEGGEFNLSNVVITSGAGAASGGNLRMNAGSGAAVSGVITGGEFSITGPTVNDPLGDLLFRNGFEN
ncbi:MAG: hypothetical protein QNJ40_20305 [Xanthomonadales bacterium]|nr:hypothetical protein [Xanthomonadales bacterium]